LLSYTCVFYKYTDSSQKKNIFLAIVQPFPANELPAKKYSMAR
jgi:hypothetical protein